MNEPLRIEVLIDQPVSTNLHDPRHGATCAYCFTCRLASGDILCSYRAGKEKHSRDGILLVSRSTDGGQSWLPPVVIYDGMKREAPDGGPESVHAGVVFELEPGRALALFKTVETSDTESFIFSEQGRQLRQQFYVASSSDGGRSWAPPNPRELPASPRDHYVGTLPAVLPGGAFFLPVEATGDAKEELVLGTISRDGGESFAPLYSCAHDRSGFVSYGDPRLTMLPDGRMVMIMWAFETRSEQTLSPVRCVSSDGGRTWSAPASTGVAGQIMAPLALDSHRMLAVSNVRTPPEGNRIWYSADAGETWNADAPLELWSAREQRVTARPLRDAQGSAAGEKIWDALPGFTFGTPELVRVDEQIFLMTYYAIVNDVTHIRACRMRVELPE